MGSSKCQPFGVQEVPLKDSKELFDMSIIVMDLRISLRGLLFFCMRRSWDARLRAAMVASASVYARGAVPANAGRQ